MFPEWEPFLVLSRFFLSFVGICTRGTYGTMSGDCCDQIVLRRELYVIVQVMELVGNGGYLAHRSLRFLVDASVYENRVTHRHTGHHDPETRCAVSSSCYPQRHLRRSQRVASQICVGRVAAAL